MRPTISVYQGLLAQIQLKKERRKQAIKLNLVRAFQ